MLAMVVLLMACRPFKNPHNNTVAVALFIILLLWYNSLSYSMQLSLQTLLHWRTFVRHFAEQIILVPPFYGIATTAMRKLLRATKVKLLPTQSYIDISESLPFRLSESQEFSS